jgi:hypothetical protein
MELLNTRKSGSEIDIPTGLAKKMDVIILNKNNIIYNKPLTIAKTIFISTKNKTFGNLIIY